MSSNQETPVHHATGDANVYRYTPYDPNSLSQAELSEEAGDFVEKQLGIRDPAEKGSVIRDIMDIYNTNQPEYYPDPEEYTDKLKRDFEKHLSGKYRKQKIENYRDAFDGEDCKSK